MSVLTLLNAKPTPKTKRQKPKPESIGLPKFNRIAHSVKFVHPPIGDQAQPEGRGKSVPATCEYATPDFPMDAIGCKAEPEAKYIFVEGSGYQLAEPTPEPTVEQPTKAQYIQAFQRQAETTGQLPPECVRQTWATSNGIVAEYIEDYAHMPRSARRPLDRYRPFDLSCAYDRALLARITWYCEHHNRRSYAAKYATTTTN